MDGRELAVLYYTSAQGRTPFRDWRNGIADDTVRAVIDARISRFRGGNLGDSVPIGSGASENRIHWGPGYRIYYGLTRDSIILLLAGTKSTQSSDINDAVNYWKDYKQREKDRKAKEKDAKDVQKRPPKRFKK